jgi:hypothetical protein
MLDNSRIIKLLFTLMRNLYLNSRYALALGGEFEVPSDFEERHHTLAELVQTVIKCLKEGEGNTFYPTWAPVKVWTSPYGYSNLSLTAEISADVEDESNLKLPLLSIHAVNLTRIRMNGMEFPIDAPGTIIDSSKEIARVAGLFFDQFASYQLDDEGFWLPPSPVVEPTSIS